MIGTQDRIGFAAILDKCKTLEDQVRSLSADPQGAERQWAEVWYTVAQTDEWRAKVRHVIGHRERLKHTLRNLHEARCKIIEASNN